MKSSIFFVTFFILFCNFRLSSEAPPEKSLSDKMEDLQVAIVQLTFALSDIIKEFTGKSLTVS
jgi:hypothetical protein